MRYIEGTSKKTNHNSNWSSKILLHSICSRNLQINVECLNKTEPEIKTEISPNGKFVLLYQKRDCKEKKEKWGDRGEKI